MLLLLVLLLLIAHDHLLSRSFNTVDRRFNSIFISTTPSLLVHVPSLHIEWRTIRPIDDERIEKEEDGDDDEGDDDEGDE